MKLITGLVGAAIVAAPMMFSTAAVAADGEGLFGAKGCAGCHAPNAMGAIGPRLAGQQEKYVAEQFKKHYGVDDGRIVVISNGVKITKRIDTVEAGKLRAQILAQLGHKEADRPGFLLFVAHNLRLKGLAVLLKARAVYSEAV